MRIIHVLAASALVCVAGVAAAQDEAQEPKAEKKICRTEATTGSLLRKKRTCLTQAQWDRIAEETKENMRRVTGRQNHQQPSNPSVAQGW